MNNNVKICSIASGSNGNAYYIENGEEAILIDIGISYKQLKNRAKARGIDIRKIKAVFITHEHSDHVRGLRVFSQNYDIDTYMTQGTAHSCRPYYMPAKAAKRIRCGETIEVGPFKVFCFAKPHDVAEPCSFRIETGGLSIGVFTDIGCACDGLAENLAECHVAFLESNYDEAMLRDGKYPEYLKRRIASDEGHLSNAQAVRIIEQVNPAKLHTLILSHLSADNNRPQIALKAFAHLAGRYKISTASRYEAGEILYVGEKECTGQQQTIVFPERLDRVELKVL
ncbi:MAG: MBL fold metallo-hydrolase [Bacteroidales bacterium]|nr:MBL fold metallo-hydrolase [Bacteroidales bacterium]